VSQPTALKHGQPGGSASFMAHFAWLYGPVLATLKHELAKL